MKQILGAFFGVALILGLAAVVSPRTALQTEPESHVQWVAKSLARMQTIKVGMSRADLLEVFMAEGGLSTPLRRTFVYRDCPQFKVDVEFTAVGRATRDREGRVTSIEDDRDVIKTISRPYIAQVVID